MWRNPNKFFHDIFKFIGQPGGNICGIERPKGKWLYQNIFPQLPETSNTPYEKELETGFVVIPYIQGATEPIKRILNNHNVQVSQKPFQTLGHILPDLRILLRKNNELTLFILFLAMTVIMSISDRPNASLVHV